MYWGFLGLSLILQVSVVSSANSSTNDPEKIYAFYKNCKNKAVLLKAYAAIVLVLQIGFKLINDKKFLKQYNWDAEVENFLKELKINNYMPILGF
jgi:hypothetical protein